MDISLEDVAALIQGQIVGDASTKIFSLASIDNVVSGSLVFAEGADNLQKAEASEAGAIIVRRKVSLSKKPLIQVDHPLKAFIQLLQHFHPPKKNAVGIHPTAVIAPGVQLGEGVSIGPYVVIESGSRIGNHSVLKSHVYIGHEVTIGENSTLHPHVTVYDHCELGSRVIVHASTVLGSDGFGYIFVDGQHLKVPHIGQVIIEDDVEIGANTAIDRATMGATLIGEGTKIDNFVQIAHNVKLGKHNLLCACTGIAGSSTVGDRVTFAANVGVSDHVRIDSNVVLGARTGVPPNKHLKEGITYLGSPARPKDIAIKQELSVYRIPFLRKNIQTLTQQLALLKERLAQIEAE